MSTVPFVAPATNPPAKPLIPVEGLQVIHLYYTVDHALWRSLGSDEQKAAKENFTRLIQSVRSHPRTQLLVFSVVTPKADLGFMLLTPDLHDANRFEKELTLALGADILQPAYSYYSMTELSEYTTTEEEYRKEVLAELLTQKEHGTEMVLNPNDVEGTEDFELRINEWRTRMKKYNQDRLYPNMALDWPVLCFYPMNKRRDGKDNWYALKFEERRTLMQGHARVGRRWHGKIRQLITGSTGLDSHEWGVTLLAHDVFHVKGIVYEMRFDEVSARYADFGDFYIGLQLGPEELLRRLGL
ncbi:MAG TPA: hydrogen peroxide-dependent heme synthase [Verrucomicrobiaceae bacterium]|jgi:chlorite dismutase